MTDEKDNVLRAAKRYVLAARDLEAELALLAGQANLLRAYRAGSLSKEGHLARASYSFHGVGCRFEDSGRVVDVELRRDGGYDGDLDAWRLASFMESEARGLPLRVVAECLEALLHDGALVLSEKSHAEPVYRLGPGQVARTIAERQS